MMQGLRYIVQYKNRLTMRAADKWDSPRFLACFWLKVGPVSRASPRSAHLQLTPAVSPLSDRTVLSHLE